MYSPKTDSRPLRCPFEQLLFINSCLCVHCTVAAFLLLSCDDKEMTRERGETDWLSLFSVCALDFLTLHSSSYQQQQQPESCGWGVCTTAAAAFPSTVEQHIQTSCLSFFRQFPAKDDDVLVQKMMLLLVLAAAFKSHI